MKVSEAITHLQAIDKIAGASETPLQGMRVITQYINGQPSFNSEVHSNDHRGLANWLRAWNRIPAAYMYRVNGGYDKFLEYAYTVRNQHVPDADALEVLEARLVEQHRTPPKGEDYEHNTHKSLYEEDDYEGERS